MTNIFRLLMVSAVALVIVASISIFAFGNSDWAYSESGCFEVAQDIILCFALIVFVLASLMRGNRQEKLITVFFAILTYTFILRELDFEKMGLPDWLVFLFHGKGRNISIAIAFIIVGILALRDYKNYIAKSIEFMLSKRGALMIIAGVLLLVGGLFDKMDKLPNNEFFEEVFELSGYFFYTSVAIMTYKKCKK